MEIQKGKVQQSSSTPSDKITRLQSEKARLRDHIAKLTAGQQSPAPRNPTPLAQPLVQVQNAGKRSLEAHLQMCSFHEHCSHNDPSWQAQQPNSTGPSNAATANISHCYFCPTWAHLTERCDRPCPHCPLI
uniref:Uncharacterized protein n=1 Tax=Romanomermis culicivorax TaxID=13658 RepID=A0A915K2Q5_ROMCU